MIYEKYKEKNMTQDMGWQSAASVIDKRIHGRIIARIKAVLTFEGVSYVGMIENISEHGLYMISLPIKHQIDFRPGSIHEMKLRTLPGKSVILHCNVQWAYKTPPYGLTNSVGMEILNPSPVYREFLGTLV
jgi:hypothetical protein